MRSAGQNISSKSGKASQNGAVDALGKPVRLRDKERRKFVSRQPCLVCGRTPLTHHVRFVQPRALGRRVSDEFTVPLCRVHHRELHRQGDEAAWWGKLSIDPVTVALKLWQHTRVNGTATWINSGAELGSATATEAAADRRRTALFSIACAQAGASRNGHGCSPRGASARRVLSLEGKSPSVPHCIVRDNSSILADRHRRCSKRFPRLTSIDWLYRYADVGENLVNLAASRPSRSGGGPNSANRCARLRTLGAAISVLLLLCLDTNATIRSTRTNHRREGYYTSTIAA